MRNNRGVFILLIVCFISTAADATIYKWVDENNQMQYSQTPPEGVNATILKEPPPAPDPEPQKAKIQQIEKQLQQTQEQKKVDALNAKNEAEEAQIRAINCERAKTYLSNLESKTRVRLRDAQGTSGPLTPEKRAAEIQKTQNNIKEYCSPKPQNESK